MSSAAQWAGGQATASDYMTGAHTHSHRKDNRSGMVRLVAGHVVGGGVK